LKFNDGEFPNKKIIKKFLNIISQVYTKKNNNDKDPNKNGNRKASTNSKIEENRILNNNILEGNYKENNINNINNYINGDIVNSDKSNKELKEEEMQPCIAVHCIAGLGRYLKKIITFLYYTFKIINWFLNLFIRYTFISKFKYLNFLELYILLPHHLFIYFLLFPLY
jgi:hypothetical protein